MGFGNWLHNVWNDVTGVTASREAASAQREGIAAAQDIYSPYKEAGEGAVDQLSALTGGLGPEAQAEAFAALEASPAFGALAAQGENAMLQNASATGGLRGGNTQGALAQYRPQLLQGMIDKQMGGLSGLAGLGFQGASGAAGLATDMGDVNAAESLNDYDLQRGMITDLAGGAIDIMTGLPISSMMGPGGGIPTGGPASTPDYSTLLKNIQASGGGF